MKKILKNNSIIKQLLIDAALTFFITVISILLLSTSTYAQNASLNWGLNHVSLSHTGISFEVSDVNHAQNAYVVIENDDNQVVMKESFSINNAIESKNITFSNGAYLKPGYYRVYLESLDGLKTDKELEVLGKDYFYVYGHAYPYYFEAKHDESDKIDYIYAEVGFKRYEGVVSNDTLVVDYPDQEPGTIVSITYGDNFGCSETEQYTVTNKNISNPNLLILREGTFLDYDSIDKDIRVCIDIAGTIYRSEYGSDFVDYKQIISYNSIPNNITSVKICSESKNGSKSNWVEKNIDECPLKSDQVDIKTYPRKSIGSVSAGKFNVKPTNVKVTINKTTYTANVQNNGTFAISYPEQDLRETLNFTFTDKHGCKLLINKDVENKYEYQDYSGVAYPNNVSMYNVPKGSYIYVVVGKKTYKKQSTNSNGKIKISIPLQKVGGSIKAYVQDDYTTEKTQIKTYKIAKRTYSFSTNIRTSKLTSVANNNSYYDTNNISKAVVQIGKKKYNAKISKKGTNATVVVSYPIQKLGTSAKLTIWDADGYTQSKSYTMKNIAPKLTYNAVDTYSTKIYGSTAANANISVKIGSKTYKCKSNKKGSYSVNIKKYKSGTKINISVKTKENYTNSKSFSVKTSSGYIQLSKYVFINSNYVTMKLTSARKGDVVKVQVGSRVYKTTVKSNSKQQTISIRISNPQMGAKVTATLYDNFGKKKYSYGSMVYFGNRLYVGMTSTQALYTTWGTPTKNYYGYGLIQWVYTDGRSHVYAYIRNGKIYSIQQLNY